MLCAKCGIELPSNSQFCLKCGHAVNAEAPKSNSSFRRFGWIALVLVLVGFGILLGSLSIGRSSKSGTATSTAQTSGATQVEAPVSAPKPRVLSTQDIYQEASPGVALIQTFDSKGHLRQQGSGFVVSSDGIVLTNYHVIRGAARATARFGDDFLSDVTGIIAYDPQRDVAVVKLASPPKTVLQLGNSDTVKVGDKIIAIGSPLGFQNTLSEGIISGVRNGILQMSDPVSPGSSGGAVFESDGTVVGISVATNAGGQNMNFAVPINWAKPYLNGGNPRSLSEIAAENTIVNSLVDGSVSIQNGQAQNWTVMFDPNRMNDAEIQGQVSSTGGLDGKIGLALTFQGQTIYSCKAITCAIQKPLNSPGVYTLVLDNRDSPMFGRTVTGQIAMKYVK